MILNENEVKTCLEFALSPLLQKYDILIKESSLTIDDQIYIQSSLAYQDHVIDLKASFSLNYQDDQFCFSEIQGQVEYLFLKVQLINILKQLCIHSDVFIKDNECYYHYALPIKSIETQPHVIEIELK